MTDIVARLRACQGVLTHDPECNCAEAADEIERLRAALQRIADYDGSHSESVRELARRALEPKP